MAPQACHASCYPGMLKNTHSGQVHNETHSPVQTAAQENLVLKRLQKTWRFWLVVVLT